MIRFLHTRIRVRDLDETIAFYEKLGFECTRRTDKSPAGNQLAFLELEGNEHFLELCYSPDFEVKFPEDLMHTCVGVDDISEYCGKLEGDDGGEESADSLNALHFLVGGFSPIFQIQRPRSRPLVLRSVFRLSHIRIRFGLLAAQQVAGQATESVTDGVGC